MNIPKVLEPRTFPILYSLCSTLEISCSSFFECTQRCLRNYMLNPFGRYPLLGHQVIPHLFLLMNISFSRGLLSQIPFVVCRRCGRSMTNERTRRSPMSFRVMRLLLLSKKESVQYNVVGETWSYIC